MKRVVCVWLPAWSIDLLRRRRGSTFPRRGDKGNPPILVVETKANQQTVVRCCEAAAEAGVRPGLTLAHARALIRHESPIIEPFEPECERRALARLALWCTRFTPIAAVHECSDFEDDSLLLDITGCDRAFHGEKTLLGLIAASLTGLRLRWKLGLGATVGEAWALAHFGERSGKAAKWQSGEVEERGNESNGRGNVPANSVPACVSSSPHSATLPLCHSATSASLRPLPIEALRLPPDVSAGLRELGLVTVGHALDLPRAALPSRFGPALLQRIDQALGTAVEFIQPVSAPPPLIVERAFEGPTTNLEVVGLAFREVIQLLCNELARRDRGVTRLRIRVDRLMEDCRTIEPRETTLVLSRPSRNPRHLWTLLRPRLEKLDMGNGVERVALLAARTRRIRHAQFGVGGPPPDESGVGELVDTLASRLGPWRVLTPELRDAHLPEHATAAAPAAESLATEHSGKTGLFAGDAPPTGSPRPSVLLDPPEDAEAIALLPDHPPNQLRWRGRALKVLVGVGPERICGEWWHAMSCMRDYFRLQDEDGRWLWAFRECASRRWFVHGLWA